LEYLTSGSSRRVAAPGTGRAKRNNGTLGTHGESLFFIMFYQVYRQVLFEWPEFFGSGCERRYAETTRIRRVASRVPLPAHHSSYSAFSELVVRSDSGSRACICERAEGGHEQQMRVFFSTGNIFDLVQKYKYDLNFDKNCGVNPCGESDQLIVHLNFAKNG